MGEGPRRGHSLLTPWHELGWGQCCPLSLSSQHPLQAGTSHPTPHDVPASFLPFSAPLATTPSSLGGKGALICAGCLVGQEPHYPRFHVLARYGCESPQGCDFQHSLSSPLQDVALENVWTQPWCEPHLMSFTHEGHGKWPVPQRRDSNLLEIDQCKCS